MQTTATDSPDTTLERATSARAHANDLIQNNPHRIGGGAPEDTDGRFSMIADRMAVLGLALESIGHAADDSGLPEGDSGVTFFMTIGGMVCELAHELEAARAIDIAQDWERQLEGGR